MGAAFAILITLVFVVEGRAYQEGQGRPAPGLGAAMHQIRGRVYLPTGAPAEERFRVTLRTFGHSVVNETFTDSLGNFEFRGVPNGTYEIVVWETDRYATEIERIEVFGRAARVFTQNIFLREKERAASERTPAGTVSLARLSEAIPKEARKEYERGAKESRKGNPQKAIVHFQRALALYPRYVQALNDLGVQYLRLNDLAQARAAFQQAIEVDPQAPHPYVNLGFLHLLQKEYEEALAHLQRAVTLDPANWSARMLCGIAFMQTGDLERAESELQKALSLGFPPAASIVRLHLANLFLRRGEYVRALEQSEKYLEEVPNATNAAEVRERVKRLRELVRAQNRQP
ncbi:MAG: tetratricopeptide repeat protein [Blastocatellia bacterium]|nr:tetratricopeptide repeat protein [Blastocatellia bacterium]MCS7156448.1 tetratricopeptide repeat protein [Blastocatellia bacterium]MCX7751811.1 tetratricopeptide repeat protein [Blastocatellia bacterium]MDW8168913.1 tetratricopeptide repeat protein [Acidobacteriota bacterium]MDW8256673.1 tetratricopeptide repeat protein [Acidobacteriota bacterium]